MSEHIIVPVDLLNDLVDPDPCWFDHHGGCQAHGYISLQPGEVCPEEATKRLIADSPRVPPDRLNLWHTVTVHASGWHMAHPITCDLSDCAFDGLAQAEWVDAPTAEGIWQWHAFEDEPWDWVEAPTSDTAGS